MSDRVSMEMLQGLVQRTLDEASALRKDVSAFREETRAELRRLGGRLTLLERRLTQQGADVAADLQGQIDELNDRIGQLEGRS